MISIIFLLFIYFFSFWIAQYLFVLLQTPLSSPHTQTVEKLVNQGQRADFDDDRVDFAYVVKYVFWFFLTLFCFTLVYKFLQSFYSLSLPLLLYFAALF